MNKGVSFERNCGAASVGEYLSDEGLTLETSAFYPLRWLIYVFNPVVNTKLPANNYYQSIAVTRKFFTVNSLCDLRLKFVNFYA